MAHEIAELCFVSKRYAAWTWVKFYIEKDIHWKVAIVPYAQ